MSETPGTTGRGRALAGTSPGLQASLLGVVLFFVFLTLRSRVFTAVDGAVRCLEVFHRQTLFFHGNNHLLYPADVFLWHRVLALFGVRAAGPLDYLALTQVMNAAAAAGCAAVLYRLTWLATGSWRAALAAACLWSFSRAFLLHATNAAEPMVGVLWSALALLLLALSHGDRRPWRPFAAGALLALAMATYQSTILIAPLAALLCVTLRGSRRDTVRASVPRLAAAAAGGLAGLFTVYGFAYQAMGVPGLAAKIDRFRMISGHGAFGGLSARSLALVPLGLATNLVSVLPDDFAGLRSLLRSHGGLAAVGAATASLAVVALALLLVTRLRRAWAGLSTGERAAFACGIAGLAFALVGPALWDPLYDKLWLQPLACASFLTALAVTRLPSPRQAGVWRIAGTAVLIVVLATNLAWAVPAHRRETPFLAEARRVAELTTDRDLVVHDWDEISVLYTAVWGLSPRRHQLDFPATAIQEREGVGAVLIREAAAARERGGRVYFLGVLDQTKASWDVLLGGRAGVPYASLDLYRQGSLAVASFPYRKAVVHLFLWQGSTQASQQAPRLGGREAEETAMPGRYTAHGDRRAGITADHGPRGPERQEGSHRADEMEGDPITGRSLGRDLAGLRNGDLRRVEQTATRRAAEQRPGRLLHPDRGEAEFRPRQVPLEEVRVPGRGREPEDPGVDAPREAQPALPQAVPQKVPRAHGVGVLPVGHEHRAGLAGRKQAAEGAQKEDVRVAVGERLAGIEHGVHELEGEGIAAPEGGKGGAAGEDASDALVGLGPHHEQRIAQRRGQTLAILSGQRAVVVKAQRERLGRAVQETAEAKDRQLDVRVADQARDANGGGRLRGLGHGAAMISPCPS